jgi:hypothetical protein
MNSTNIIQPILKIEKVDCFHILLFKDSQSENTNYHSKIIENDIILLTLKEKSKDKEEGEIMINNKQSSVSFLGKV